MKTYMGLYTAIVDHLAGTRVLTGFPPSVSKKRGYHLFGEDLYVCLDDCLRSHVQRIGKLLESCDDNAVLAIYVEQWIQYTTAARYNNHLFEFLNRHFVRREREEDKKHFYPVYTLHLVRWKADLFTGTHERIMRLVLDLIEKHRNGASVDVSTLKSIIDSFVRIGVEEPDLSKPTLVVYKEYFEKPFLEATSNYYRNESSRFLVENSVFEYMKMVEARLQEEKKFCSLHLMKETEEVLIRTCERRLISDHRQVIREEFQRLLDQDDQEELGRMYRLLACENYFGHDPLVKLQRMLSSDGSEEGTPKTEQQQHDLGTENEGVKEEDEGSLLDLVPLDKLSLDSSQVNQVLGDYQ